ncbi:MAG: hypothetical protein AB7N76_13545 [Planctomycetota bacterium]
MCVGAHLRETFLSPVSGQPWREADYERSWREGVRRALEEGRGALITAASRRTIAVSCWPLYRVRGWVIAQPRLLRPPPCWSWDEPWAHIPRRDPPLRGARVPDYRAPVADVEQWLEVVEDLRGW